jgi:DNA-cytosine methyltransferase
MKIKVLSLFDGISVAQQALKELGYDVEYYASEIDKYAIQLTQRNHPKTVQLGDVKTISEKMCCLTGEMPLGKIDLLIGGSPCQDLSIAKKNRQGLDGARSGLFWEYVRILKEVKPKYFVLENVNSMPKEAKAIITEALGVEPIMINASLVSAQNRKRLFWTNIPNVTLPEDRNILLKDILEENVDFKYCISSNQAHATITENKSSPMTQAMGMGGGHVPYISKEPIRIGKFNSGGQGDRIYSPEGKSVGLSALGGGRGAKTGLYAIPVALRNRGEGKKPEYNGTDKANSMTTVQTDSMVQENSIIRKLTPIECERLQSLPDNYTEGISNSQRYKCLGNAFNKEVVKHILSFTSLTPKGKK